jgi:hypothetical protein
MGNWLVACPPGGQIFRLGLQGAEVAQGGVFSEAVVEDFDVVEDIGPQLGLIGEDMVAHGGGFVATVKRLHGRVVVAVALAAHARVHSEPGEQSLVAITGVGAAAVTVMHDALADFATGQGGILQRGADQLGIVAIRYAPADDATRAQVHHRGQVIPAGVAEQIRGVGHPDLVAMFGFTQFTQQVRMVAKQVVTVGAHRFESRLSLADQVEFMHQAQGAITTTLDTCFAQVTMHRPVAICSRASTPDLGDSLFDHLILTATGRGLGLTPTVVSAARDAQRFAHLCEPINVLMSFHIFKPAHTSLAK